jgi:CrcB protein
MSLRILAVALGGALGAVLRYLVSGWVERSSFFAGGRNLGGLFPWGTLVVNLSGCLALGLLAGLFQRKFLLAPDLRALLFLGLLGSYTTFSTFSLETLRLMEDGSWTLALLNGLGSPLLGLAGAWVGTVLARMA